MNVPGLADLRRVRALVGPRVVRRLAEAGAFDPRAAVGAAKALPWLVGRGPSLGILGQVNANAFGEKVAIHDRDGALTWGELERRANRLAHGFAELGLSGGMRVATLLRNGREQVETIVAGQKLGLAVAPLNTWGQEEEIRHALEQTEPRAIVYDTRQSAQLRGAVNENDVLIAVRGSGGRAIRGSTPYEEFLSGRPDGAPSPVVLSLSRPRARILIHTSGTTGKAKAASRTTSGLWGMIGLLAVVPLTRDDVVLLPAPLFHSFGLLSLTLSMLLGCAMVMPERFDPEGALASIEAHRATAACFVPVMMRRVLDLPKSARSKHDLSSLRIVLASGSAISPEMRGEIRDLFGDVLYDLYGSTEAGWVAIATPQDMADEPRTVGRPVPAVEVAVFGEKGERLDAGKHGEIGVRSDASFEGYASGERTKVQAGYLSMGDVGWLDDDGRLFVEGRADDMVVVGGENVYPAEVEEVIQSLRGVREAAVFGVPDAEYGQVLAAFVEGSAKPDAVKAACKKRLASFKVPRIVEIVDELPRTGTGKVRKKQLIEQVKGSA